MLLFLHETHQILIQDRHLHPDSEPQLGLCFKRLIQRLREMDQLQYPKKEKTMLWILAFISSGMILNEF